MNTPEVAHFAGVTYRQVDHWLRRGYIRASNDGMGSGNPRDFTVHEARVTKVLADLVRAGFAPEAAAVVAREVERDGLANVGRFRIEVKR